MTTDRFDPTEPLGPRTLIEASAGTGKTYALCGLTAHLLGTGAITVDELLVVTFTTMATADLKDRIRERLVSVRAALDDAADESDDEVVTALRAEPRIEPIRERLDRALADLGGLAVSTIHGFTQRALAAFGSAAGIEADLPILVNDGDLLHAAVADELAAHAITLSGADGDDRKWIPPINRVLQVVRELAAVPDIVLEPADALVTEPYADLVDEHRSGYLGLKHALEAELEAEAEKSGKPPTKKARDEIRARLDEEFDAGEVIRATWLAQRAADRARRARRAAGVRNYTDLLTDLRDALQGESGAELAAQIADRHRIVLIDEFQDTDRVQWEIFDACFGHDDGSRLVVVGDPKQAVYRFRGADVYTYARVSGDEGIRGRSLDTNYRTDGPLLHAIGTLFDGVPFGPRADFVPVGAHHRTSRIRWRTPGPSGTSGTSPVTGPVEAAGLTERTEPNGATDRDGTADPNGAADPGDGTGVDRILPPLRLAHTSEGRRDASRIVHADAIDWIRRLRRDAEIERGGRWRRVGYADIALLVTMNSHAIALQAELRDAGIPASIHADDDVRLDSSRAVYDGGSKRFTSPPSEAAWNWRLLLEAIARPSDVARIRSAITTVFGPEPDPGPENPSGSNKTGLLALIDDEDAIGVFHQKVATWARILTEDGPPALITALRTTTDWMRRAALRDDDGRLLTDLEQIGEVFAALAGSGPASVDDLLTVLTATDEDSIEGASEVTARRLSSDAPSVRIMTIHKSKGLEFPIVGCFGLSTSRAPQKSKTAEWVPARHHRHRPEEDDWIEVLDAARMSWSLDAERNESEDDELRRLYVAFTRAAHHVFAHVEAPPPDKPAGPLPRVLFHRNGDGDLLRTDAADGTASRIADRLAEDERLTDGELLDVLVERSRPAPGEAPTIARVELDSEPDPVPDETAPEKAASDDPDPEGTATGSTTGTDATETASGDDAPADGGTELEPPVLEVAEIGPIDRRARRWSFTGVTGAMRIDTVDTGPAPTGGRDEGTEPPDGADTPAPEPRERTSSSRPRSRLQSLRAGADFGVLVHELLENTDFAIGPDELRMKVEHALAGRRPSLITGPGQSVEEAIDALVDGLIDSFAAPLGPLGPGGTTLRLRDIAVGDRLDECDFDLRLDTTDGVGDESTGARIRALLLDPVRGLAPDDPYRRWAEELGRRNFELDLAGFLTGSIDLVHRVDHGDRVRFHIADHKTNRLDSYDPDSIARAMADHDYPLQALLYSVGLHRYLRWRLPGYDPDRNLGDVTYLFLRGMTSDEPADTENPPGVARWRIPTTVVVGLDAIFAGREVPTP